MKLFFFHPFSLICSSSELHSHNVLIFHPEYGPTGKCYVLSDCKQLEVWGPRSPMHLQVLEKYLMLWKMLKLIFRTKERKAENLLTRMFENLLISCKKN